MRITILSLGVLALSAGNLSAGYVLTYHLDRYSNEGVKTKRCVETDYIDARKMRVEMACADEGAHSVTNVSIFRGDKNLTWQVDPASRHYTEMTRSEIQKNRKRFEAAMESPGGHSYQPTGKRETVKNWTCTIYQHLFHGTLSDESCIAEEGVVFKGANEAEAIKRDLLETLDPLAIDPEEQNQLADLAMGRSRFTLKQVNILLDQPAYVLTFTQGHSASLPASIFELPRGAIWKAATP